MVPRKRRDRMLTAELLVQARQPLISAGSIGHRAEGHEKQSQSKRECQRFHDTPELHQEESKSNGKIEGPESEHEEE